MKLLKKLFPTLLATLMIAALCVPALAQTTSIALDGEVYTFVGDAGSYQANGKTFIIGRDSVTVRAPGEADRVLPLMTSTGEATVSGAAYTGATYTSWDDDIEIAWDGSSAEAVESTDEAALMVQDSTAVESGRASAENMHTFCAPYAEFGLSYDAEHDTLVYMGKAYAISRMCARATVSCPRTMVFRARSPVPCAKPARSTWRPYAITHSPTRRATASCLACTSHP